MPKQVLNEEQYIAKLNELLKQQDYFKPGMAVVFAPPGASGPTASGLEISGGLQPGNLADLKNKVLAEFDVQVTMRKPAA